MLKFNNSNPENTVFVSVTNRTLARFVLYILSVILGVIVFRKASHAFILIFMALFLTLALNAPVHWLAQRIPGRKRGSRSVATIVSVIVVILVLGGFVASIAPPLVRQTNTFIAAAPSLVKDAKNDNTPLGQFIKKYKLEKSVDKFSSQLSTRLENAGGAFSTLSRISSSVFSILTVMVLTFMMLVEGPAWIRLFKDIVPDEHHERIDRLARGMYKVIKGYVNGQVFLAAMAAVLISPVFFILGVSYPIALMVVVFVCGLIPMVGHTLGALIVSSVALFTSPMAAIIVISYYFIYQQIENYLIQPKIQANSTNMSPLLVFVSVVVGVSFGGLVGGLVAIPVMGCVRIVVLDYLHTKKIIEREAHQNI